MTLLNPLGEKVTLKDERNEWVFLEPRDLVEVDVVHFDTGQVVVIVGVEADNVGARWVSRVLRSATFTSTLESATQIRCKLHLVSPGAKSAMCD